jgi:hypothetical protein
MLAAAMHASAAPSSQRRSAAARSSGSHGVVGSTCPPGGATTAPGADGGAASLVATEAASDGASPAPGGEGSCRHARRRSGTVATHRAARSNGRLSGARTPRCTRGRGLRNWGRAYGRTPPPRWRSDSDTPSRACRRTRKTRRGGSPVRGSGGREGGMSCEAWNLPRRARCVEPPGASSERRTMATSQRQGISHASSAAR